MGFDDKLRSGCLKPYTPLDTNDGVAHVSVAADGVRSTNLLNFLNGGNLVVECFVVDCHYLALVECDFQYSLLFLGGDML